MSFSSKDTKLSDILQQIDEGIIQLPDFQRGWVWDDLHLRGLIASLSNSYPIGALMFLDNSNPNIHFKSRLFENAENDNARPSKLVLDGQQRLTSIYCALYNRKPVNTQTEKKKSIKRYYYLDIIKALDPDADRIDAVVSIPDNKILMEPGLSRTVKYDLRTREDEFREKLFPLNLMFSQQEIDNWRYDYEDYYNLDTAERKRLQAFSREIIDSIRYYQVPVITLGDDVPKEAVCQVFENVNTGGVALNVFELVTASYAADNFQLRDDWYGIRDKDGSVIQNGRLQKITAKSPLLTKDDEGSCVFEPSDFLQACTLYYRYFEFSNGGKALSCKKKDVLGMELSDYLHSADKVMDGLIEAAKFLQRQRIFSFRDLPYTTQLVPLSVIFAILGTRTQDSTVISKIAFWYWCGVFGEMYGGANESRYVQDVSGVIDWVNGGSEPDTVERASFHPSRLLTLNSRLSAAYKGVMALLLKTDCSDWISGEKMDFTVFVQESTDIHHIFPKNYCSRAGIPYNKCNSIINKTPLYARTNRIIGGVAPSVYTAKIVNNDYHVTADELKKNIETHLIDYDALVQDDFNTYFEKRTRALLDLISKAMGKSVSGISAEESMRIFGFTL